MDMKLCNRFSKIKISDSKVCPGVYPKPPKLCSDYFSLATEGIVLNLFDMINVDI